MTIISEILQVSPPQFWMSLKTRGTNVLVNILSGLMNSFVLLLCLPVLDVRIAAIVLAGMLIYMYFTSSMEHKTRTLSPVRQKNQAALVSRVLESLQGMSVIKSFNLTGKGDSALIKAIDDNRDSNLALEKCLFPTGWFRGSYLPYSRSSYSSWLSGFI